MKIINSIDLIEDISNYDVILVGTNTYLTMGNGFQKKIKDKYPEVYKLNLTTKYGDINKLGMCLVCDSYDTIFVLCFITNSYNFRPDIQKDFLNYDSLSSCLETIKNKFNHLKIATTLIGGSKWDGNGDRDVILSLIEDKLKDCDITIYDKHQECYKQVEKQEWYKLKELRKENISEYYKEIKKRKIKQNEQNKNRDYFRE